MKKMVFGGEKPQENWSIISQLKRRRKSKWELKHPLKNFCQRKEKIQHSERMGGDRGDSRHAALVIKQLWTRDEVPKEESAVTREKTATGIKKQDRGQVQKFKIPEKTELFHIKWT